jgi:hypothetical protein
MLKFWLSIAAMTCLAACQLVRSSHVDYGAGPMANGLQYAVPKAVIKVELIASGGTLGRYISQPFLIGDPEADYVLNTSSSLFAESRYFFVVNPQTRLLTHINATSDGKAGKNLATLAESIGAISGTDKKRGGDETRNLLIDATLFSTFIDPFEYEGCDFGVACELTVLDNAAGSAVRAKVNASASPSGSAALVPPDVSNAPKVDPDAANDKTDEH